jgi:hypothetical protein
MSKPIETVQLDNGEAIEVFQDEDPTNPREWDNLGHMLNLHDRYYLGDENTTRSKLEDEMNANADFDDYKYFQTWEDVERYLTEERGAINLLPIMLHDHSGLSMYVGTSGDRWDSSRIGYIYTTEQKIKDQGLSNRDDIDFILRNEIKLMDKYLQGDYYGYQIVRYVTCDHGDTHREILDSCWGWDTIETAIDEAKQVVGGVNAN